MLFQHFSKYYYLYICSFIRIINAWIVILAQVILRMYDSTYFVHPYPQIQRGGCSGGGDLKDILEYEQWRNFLKVVEKSKKSCKNAKNDVREHFADVSKMVVIGHEAKREIDDIMLSRYACYLIVQNGDPRKEIIALESWYTPSKFERSLYSIFRE